MLSSGSRCDAALLQRCPVIEGEVIAGAEFCRGENSCDCVAACLYLGLGTNVMQRRHSRGSVDGLEHLTRVSGETLPLVLPSTT